MKICYAKKTFTAAHEAVIRVANSILEEYDRQGFDLTLRQLYYQFVARGVIPNSDQSYNRLGEIVSAARMAGRIDWDYITDRTRHARRNAHWETPAGVIESAAASYQIDKWADQPKYIEVWVEKDALIGVIDQACRPLDVTYFSCRGYTSISEVWRAAMRMLLESKKGKELHLIHLGDHDPSGVDMSRDIEDRLRLFPEHHGHAGPVVNRIALTMRQIRRFNPPPQPAKMTDSRGIKYIKKYGGESWELDALEPTTLAGLIRDAIFELRDVELWAAAVEKEKLDVDLLNDCSKRWGAVQIFLNKKGKKT